MKFAVATTSLALAGLLAASALLSACAPLLVGGAVAGSAMVVTDRRTSGTQLEDESIELKSLTRIRETVGDTAHVSATSYDRIVLLTGEVPSEAAKTAVAQAISRIENVRSVVNELAVMEATSLTERSGDALLTTRVKTAFIDAKDVFANAIKVVSERGNVYLMGKVTEREANRATDLARSVGGVKKVVRVFEIISEAALADIQPKQAPASK
jgi:osmotically-inducible protein OsmY